jgi:hemerythrin superfamily protein
MDALELLESQHREVESLFSEIEETEDHEDKLALFGELADALAAHATIEEKLFYPAAYANATQELLAEAVEEHLAAKRILADLLTMSPGDEQFDAKVKVLKEQIEHHVDEEEDELFPQVRETLAAEELEALGEQMEELFDKALEQGAADDVPAETTRAASIKPRGKRAQQPARQ